MIADLCKEAGPGSYEIQDSIGRISYKHYNYPRPIIARAKRTDKLFLSSELSKQLSGMDSPGVFTYSPKLERILEKSPSAVFGTSKRSMSYLSSYIDRSPGPVYIESSRNSKAGISFSRARRNSNIESSSPAPWDYNPVLPSVKVPSVILKAVYEKINHQPITPGPGSYNITPNLKKAASPKKITEAYASKIGRNIIENRVSPGPGSYENQLSYNPVNVKIGNGKRNLDPKNCNS